MQITMRNVVDGEGALARLVANKFPVKIAYKLKRIITDAGNEIRAFQEHRSEIIKRYGEEQENGGWQVKEDQMGEFTKEFEDLFAIPVSVWGDPIDLDDLGDISISPADLLALHWLFKEEDEAAPQLKADASTA